MHYSSRSPVRLSFSGGGTDVSPYCEDHGGCVLNATISKFTWVSLRRIRGGRIISGKSDGRTRSFRDLRQFLANEKSAIRYVAEHFNENYGLKGGFEAFERNDAPGMSGLGGSACFFVSAINAFRVFTGADLSRYEMAELAYGLERLKLGNIGGRQDQYACAFGGINFIEFKGNDFVRINPLQLKHDHLLELEKRLVLVNLGKRRKSGDIISDQVRRVERKEKGSLEALHETKEIAIGMKHALLGGDLDGFARLLNVAWQQKKRFSPLISNPYIDRVYAFSLRNGAAAGKITGAGGGGHMMLLAQPNMEERLKRALERKGLFPVPFTFQMHGVESWTAK